MTASMLVKDVGELYQRLFDHRPFLQSEIAFILSEFEEKRGDREQKNFSAILSLCKDINENLIMDTTENMAKHVPEIIAKTKTASDICEVILERETHNPQFDWLKSERANRAKDWSQFMDSMCEKSSAVDDEFNDEAQQIRNYYHDLEEKLRIAPSPT